MNIDKMKEYFNKKRCVYVITFNESVAYVGQTQQDVATRIAQHLAHEGTVKKYIRKYGLDSMHVEVVYEYKRKHQNIEKWLDAKETEFMKKYKQMGYKLINVKKMKNL
jgi:predicted GIY-YIG superfamily endonuclease